MKIAISIPTCNVKHRVENNEILREKVKIEDISGEITLKLNSFGLIDKKSIDLKIKELKSEYEFICACGTKLIACAVGRKYEKKAHFATLKGKEHTEDCELIKVHRNKSSSSNTTKGRGRTCKNTIISFSPIAQEANESSPINKEPKSIKSIDDTIYTTGGISRKKRKGKEKNQIYYLRDICKEFQVSNSPTDYEFFYSLNGQIDHDDIDNLDLDYAIFHGIIKGSYLKDYNEITYYLNINIGDEFQISISSKDKNHLEYLKNNQFKDYQEICYYLKKKDTFMDSNNFLIAKQADRYKFSKSANIDHLCVL